MISSAAAIVMAKLMCPETEAPADESIDALRDMPKTATNVMDAAAEGATDGLKLALNVAAPLRLTRAFVAAMRVRGSGHVVTIGSAADRAVFPANATYAATKHAMAGFFDSLRIELDGTGVTVTMIYPGFVFSEINQRALSPDGTPFGDRGYTRRKGETMETDRCGRLILAAVANRNRDLVMTWRGKIGRMLKLMSPALVDRIAKGVIESRQ